MLYCNTKEDDVMSHVTYFLKTIYASKITIVPVEQQQLPHG